MGQEKIEDDENYLKLKFMNDEHDSQRIKGNKGVITLDKSLNSETEHVTNNDKNLSVTNIGNTQPQSDQVSEVKNSEKNANDIVNGPAEVRDGKKTEKCDEYGLAQ